MYKILSFFLFLFITLFSEAQYIRVISFNIRYDNPGDGDNQWSKRSDAAISFLNYENADFIGMQEVLKHQLDNVQDGLDGYQWIGVGRDDGKLKGEFSPLFYNSNKWELVKSGTFWLSESPDKPSKSWDAALPRICTWGNFKHKGNGKSVWVFNTHYDHRGEEARKNASLVIQKMIGKLAGDQRVILTGDFNATEATQEISSITASGLQDSFVIARKNYGEVGTFNGFDSSKVPENRIDYVFVNRYFDVSRYTTDSRIIDGRFLSDHFPIIVELKINN